MPVDSFDLRGATVGQQCISLQYLNDSTFAAYDLTAMQLAFFRRDSRGNFKASETRRIDTEFWSMHFKDDAGKHYFTDRNNTITVYNTPGDSLLARYTIPHRFPYLKDSFALSVANNSPVSFRHDTMIAAISPNSNEALRLCYQENEVSEFRIVPGSDTLHYLRSYLRKPSTLGRYELPLGMYTFVHNTVFLLYPSYDTIYSFNRSSGTTRHIAIGNPDFTQPATFICKPFTPSYGSCATKYYLHNFRYYGIHYNSVTRHFLLFYNAPVKAVKGRLPSANDQPLQVLVLNEAFEVLGTYRFDKNLEAGGSFLMIPGKGLAMPVLNELYENTRFYIYNL